MLESDDLRMFPFSSLEVGFCKASQVSKLLNDERTILAEEKDD